MGLGLGMSEATSLGSDSVLGSAPAAANTAAAEAEAATPWTRTRAGRRLRRTAGLLPPLLDSSLLLFRGLQAPAGGRLDGGLRRLALLLSSALLRRLIVRPRFVPFLTPLPEPPPGIDEMERRMAATNSRMAATNSRWQPQPRSPAAPAQHQQGSQGRSGLCDDVGPSAGWCHGSS